MYYQYLNGQLKEGEGKVFSVINPATNEVVDQVSGANGPQALQALEDAQAAFKSWSKKSTLDERIGWLNKLFEEIKKEKETILDLLMAESGKPWDSALEDWGMLENNFQFYAEEARRVYGVSIPAYNADHSGTGVYHVIEKRPLGVVVSHLAWNYPLLNLSLKICPAIVSGCTCVIKPSSQTPLTALYIGVLAERIGFPKGVLNIIAGPAGELGEALNSSTIPKLITLIGSDDTAKEIMRQGANSIKRYSFELGGIAPVIVCEDADTEMVAQQIVNMKCANAGQMCTDYNRIYIHESIYEDVCAKVLDKVSKIKVGYGKDEGWRMGPMINSRARDKMFSLIEDAVSKGARLIYGGTIPEGYEQGNFILPALLLDTTNDMEVNKKETFGPIIPLQPYSDFEKALDLAVEGDYGLSSYIFTHDSRKIARAYERFESGEVMVNEAPCVTCNTPHVGARQSGVGCDGSFWSLEEYYQLKRLSMVP